jgi:hypothetical protein
VNGTGNNLGPILKYRNEKRLPQVRSNKSAGDVRVQSPVQFRYYMNVCTNSYSMVWWDWKRWQEEIDWMAMNGINLPLSFTGTEYILRELFLSFGVTRAEIGRFFAGPGWRFDVIGCALCDVTDLGRRQ